MPIIVIYRNGQHEVFQSRDKRGLIDFRYLNMTTLGGHETDICKEDVRRIEYFPDDEWNENVEAAKKKTEEEETARKKAEERPKIPDKVRPELERAEPGTIRERIKRWFGGKTDRIFRA